MKADCTLRTDYLRKTLFSLILACGAAAFGGAPLCAQTYSGPITITTGGSYSGNWQSNDSNTPAVVISTSSPVTITNSNIKGPGDLIRVADGVDASQVTVLNTYGYGTYPTQAGTEKGCFLFVLRPASVDVEHCYIEGTGDGLVTSGYGGSPNAVNPIKFLYNRGLNMDGRYINGSGGYTTGQNYGIGPGYDRYFSHFVQISGASDHSGYGIPGADIGWNEIVNLPSQSSVDDNFSLFQASGTPANRILFHDNYVQGGYGSTPTVENNGSAFQMDSNGTGQDESTPALSTAYAHIYNNSVVNCIGGVESSTGHDVEIDHNRVFFSAQLPDGTPLNSLYSLGLGIQDYLSKDNRSSTVGGTPTNFAHNNFVGSYMYKQPYPPVRFDYMFATDAVDPARNVVNDSTDHVLPWNANPESNGPDSQQACLAAERAEYGTTWLPKLQQNGVTIGPTNNLVVNPGFENGGAGGWTRLSSSGGGLQDISYLFDGGLPHGGNDCLLQHGGSTAWQEQTGQDIHGLHDGSYTLSAWCRRSAPQVRCRIGVRKFGGKKQLTSPLVAPPLTGSSDWAQYSVSFSVTNASTASAQDGSAEIFFLSGGNSDQSSAADDFVLRATPLAVFAPPSSPNRTLKR